MKSSAIYISSGNNDTFGKYAIKKYSQYCDIIINYYGSNGADLNFFKTHAKRFSKLNTTKFISLKENYHKLHINKYDCVYVFDDDCIPVQGNLLDLYKILINYSLALISPSHDPRGKGLIKLMHHKPGSHKFRYTNFIEMNFPVFSQEALHKYMKIYDGKLCGWGNDWWFCHVNNCYKILNCGIYDNVIVRNPFGVNKKQTYGELNDHTYSKIEKSDIDNFMTKGDRRQQWIKTMLDNNIREWHRKNLKYVYA
jgi:hypothetical protein